MPVVLAEIQEALVLTKVAMVVLEFNYHPHSVIHYQRQAQVWVLVEV